MIDDYKIVIVIPAGRKRYMEVVLPFILREKKVIDKVILWVNTRDEGDLMYMDSLVKKHKGWVELDKRYSNTPLTGKSKQLHLFFDKYTSPDTVYIRLDDDVVWLDDKYIEKLALFTIENRQYALVYGNIMNNAVIDHIQQRRGLFPGVPIMGYNCLDPVGWRTPAVAEKKHRQLLIDIGNKDLKKYDFGRWELYNHERVSINSLAWVGTYTIKWIVDARVGEETWLSQIYPDKVNRINCVYGGALCAHFSFFTTRDHMDSTDILNKYKQLGDKI